MGTPVMRQVLWGVLLGFGATLAAGALLARRQMPPAPVLPTPAPPPVLERLQRLPATAPDGEDAPSRLRPVRPQRGTGVDAGHRGRAAPRRGVRLWYVGDLRRTGADLHPGVPR